MITASIFFTNFFFFVSSLSDDVHMTVSWQATIDLSFIKKYFSEANIIDSFSYLLTIEIAC